MDGKRRIQKKKIFYQAVWCIQCTSDNVVGAGSWVGALRKQKVILLSPSPFKLIPLDSYFFFILFGEQPILKSHF
jgi:hypothetical protein